VSADQTLRVNLEALRQQTDHIVRIQLAEQVARLAVEVQDQELLRALADGVTQTDVAHALGISQAAISQRVQHARGRSERRAHT
jgi:predicted transcriptional regulator